MVSLPGCVFALTLGMLAQAGVPPRGAPPRDSLSGLIVGQVVDGDNGRPVGGALVTISGPPGPYGIPLPRVLTRSDGRFVFQGLRSGNYNIVGFKGGVTEGAHGRMRPAGPSSPLTVADGARIGDVVIRMWRHASISGSILDESGERLIGVRVQAYRRAIISGRRRYVPAGTASTDDRGVYRIGGLIPGDYIVGAAARNIAQPLSMGPGELAGRTIGDVNLGVSGPGTPMVRMGDAGYLLGNGIPTPPPPQQGRLTIYPPVFHPDAPAGEVASVIPLRAGAEYLNADLRLAPVRVVSVSGYVLGPDGLVISTPIRLVAANAAEIALEGDVISTVTDRAGRFTFPAVPSGHYTLRLQRGASSMPVPHFPADRNTLVWVDLPVSVGNEDIAELPVEAHPGLRVAGRIEFERSAGQSSPASTTFVSIEPADATPGSGDRGSTAPVDASGNFRSPPLPGGRYYVRVPSSPAGWMFKSATVEGRDAADVPLTLAGDVSNVVVTFTDRWSGLRGMVQNRQGADPGAAVLVFPVDTEAWGSSGLNPRRVRMVRPGRAGDYSLNLPPGEYFALAVPDAEAADWQDPAFLEAASRAAARVTVTEGERQTQDLRTRTIR